MGAKSSVILLFLHKVLCAATHYWAGGLWLKSPSGSFWDFVSDSLASIVIARSLSPGVYGTCSLPDFFGYFHSLHLNWHTSWQIRSPSPALNLLLLPKSVPTRGLKLLFFFFQPKIKEDWNQIAGLTLSACTNALHLLCLYHCISKTGSWRILLHICYSIVFVNIA